MYRIDPYEHPIGRQELLAHLAGEFLVVHRRLGMDADSGKLLENPGKAIILWGGGAPGLGIATPQNSNFVRVRVWVGSVHATLLAWRVAQSLDGCLTGCLLDPAAMLSAPYTADNTSLTPRLGGRRASGRTLFGQVAFAAVSRSRRRR